MKFAKIKELLVSIVSNYTDIEHTSIKTNVDLEEYGFDSFMVMDISDELKEQLGITIPATVFFECKTIDELSEYIENENSEENENKEDEESFDFDDGFMFEDNFENRMEEQEVNETDIAIVGVSGRFPCADDIYELWENLINKKDCVTKVPIEFMENTEDVLYCNQGGFLKEIADFDSVLFHIMPKEARKMDPQIRLFLQEAWHAIEDAGYDITDLKGHFIGTFAGAMWGQYQNYGVEETAKGRPLVLESSLSAIANRVSFAFDWKGPSMTVDTMCSSSLTALHLACKSIRDGECEAALVGGLNLNLHKSKYIAICDGKFGSGKGKCHSFGKDGDGYVPGEGIVAIFVKPLTKAIAEHDNIYGVIKEDVLNHGGKTNGFTVPSPVAQQDLLRKALSETEILPESITYIEAHGTGTKLGDPIEMKAIHNVYGENRKDKCAVGSLKSNIGHLEGASGLAGIVKILLQMKYQKIVPSLHSEIQNPLIPFDKIPFYVPQKVEPWKSENALRRASVSSFGAGGSNGHVVVEEFRNKKSEGQSGELPFLISARSKEQLFDYIDAYCKRIDDITELRDMGIIQAIGRKVFKWRLFFVYNGKAELKEKLLSIQNGSLDGVCIKEVKEELGKSNCAELDEAGKLWCEGYEIDWREVLHITSFSRVHLPGYPFEKKYVWYDDFESVFHWEKKNQSEAIFTVCSKVLLEQHSYKGRCILPGVTFIEMARYYSEKVLNREFHYLESVHWIGQQPTEKPVRMVVQEQDTKISFEFSDHESGHNLCTMTIGVQKDLGIRRKNSIEEKSILLKQDIYHNFSDNQLIYGEEFQNIEKILLEGEKSEAFLEEMMGRKIVNHTLKRIIMLDMLLQAAIGFQEERSLPVKLAGVSLQNDILFGRKIEVRKLQEKEQSYYICLVDDNGRVLAQIEQADFRLDASGRSSLSYFTEIWKEKSFDSMNAEMKLTEKILCIGHNQEHRMISEKLNGQYINVTEAEDFNLDGYGKVLYLLDENKPVFKEVFESAKKWLKVQHKTDIVLIALKCPDDKFYKEFCALEAFMKTIEIENSSLQMKLVLLDESSVEEQKIKAELDNMEDKLVMYEEGQRKLRVQQAFSVEEKGNKKLEKGIYVFAGGGSLAESIMDVFHKENADIQMICLKRNVDQEFEQRTGSKVMTCDITNQAEVLKVFSSIREMGEIKGVVMTAGIIKDAMLRDKILEDAQKVVNTKVQGVENLNMAVKDDKIQCFFILSSIAGIIGNVGQSDYAYANSYLSFFAEERNKKVMQGIGYGETKALCIPLISNSGMSMEQKVKTRVEKKTGLKEISRKLFEQIVKTVLKQHENNMIVCYGEASRYEQLFTLLKSQKEKGKGVMNQRKNHNIEQEIKELIANIIEIPVSEIDNAENLFTYGVDSVTALDIAEAIEEKYELDISATFLFEEKSVNEISNYVREHIQSEGEEEIGSRVNEAVVTEERRIEKIEDVPTNVLSGNKDDIAIIGVSGNYPLAEDVYKLGELLKNGIDAVTKIPEERWNNEKYYAEIKGEDGKYYSQYGSFLHNYKQFDAPFFNISSEEASRMDPQERLMLQESWKCIEDAGYKVSSLSKSKVGVFIGAMWTMYQLYGYENYKQGVYKYSDSSLASIANRVSYQFNLQGPSMTLDTMCSSTLSALYLACQNLMLGECEYCLVGSVNLALHPYKYLQLCDKQFLSADGKCRSFGNGGEGYVPGEGVGAILLKPLKKAKADGDHIYGVVKGVALNHGGFSGGFTVPNPEAQIKVIKEALEKSKLSAEQVSYIETHGTGTAIGDPIEIKALEKVYGNREKACSIGSVKSNLGHLEAAAGILSITKVLLQFQNKSLYPSLHSKEKNPLINWNKIKFTVQQDCEPWNTDGNIPRTAGISSFGAGGSNAHLILEEYPQTIKPQQMNQENLILISAKTEESLKAWCQKFQTFLEEERNPMLSLEQIAYTLQTGRESCRYKIAFLVSDKEELKEKIEKYLKKDEVSYRSNGQQDNNICQLMNEEDASEFIRKLTEKKKYEQLIMLWFNGVDINWKHLYSDRIIQKASLPAYEFEKKEYWIVNEETSKEKASKEVQENKIQINEKTEEKSDSEFSKTVLKTINELLGTEETSNELLEYTLLENGFSSIYALKLLNQINKDFHVEIKLFEVKYDPSKKMRAFIDGINEVLVQKTGDTKSLENVKKNLNFTGTLFPEKEKNEMRQETVLLTGATGNLGTGILYYYLKETDKNVICLVRGKDPEDGKNRIREAMSCYGECDEEEWSRVKVCIGDIVKKGAGLAKEDMDYIVEHTDLVLHSAASTNLSGDYEEVKEVNNTGTENMIELSLQTKNKYMVFLSTHMVIGNQWYEEEDLFFDEQMLNNGQSYKNFGYQKSKTESEIMVRNACEKGLKWIVMRMGNIMGRSTDGAFPLNRGTCLYYDILKTAVKMKAALDTDLLFDVTPVDYACRSILALAEYGDIYDTYHIKNKDAVTMNRLYKMIEHTGRTVEILDEESYQKKINSVTDFTSIFMELSKYNPIYGKTIRTSSLIDNDYTLCRLEEYGIESPELNEELIKTYLDYCDSQNYLK
ncbi:beta-ketoacyl synthase N-terminal-like domain-containing protein [[Clostridium] polysaccharolyticum]|uniref:Thioester reductase domain-containing protein n=1 Tax=[Clostridium] polysaccharolyticum TaxID=29364 RepID=A0A1I0E6U1_9FIRM|nr:beta-ketoacyl synthase N-terminal-like domain-containing protein [[Clostridium] polysaccharolyticum]SET39997.1 thioester reductase domain-containing protein [[Clostridium] polysaccharolyticum]